MAKKTKYHFNKETLSYEKIEVTFLKVLRDIGIYTFVGIVIGVATFFAASKLFSSPMEKSLKKENEELQTNREAGRRNERSHKRLTPERQ